MKKILLIVIILIGAFYIFNAHVYDEKQAVTAADHKNAEYVIDGERVKLENGRAESEAAPDSASKITTAYFGNEVVADLNDDGRDDVVFLLTQEAGGSGTFFYVVAALNTENGYVGSSGLLLGDRIAPQSIHMSQNPNHKNVIVVNYADRAPGEDFTTPPSVGKSVWLKLDPESMQFGEVVQNFGGEADPSRMTLDMKTWEWIRTQYNNDTSVEPNESGVFTITFNDDGSFTTTTDCNTMGGNYAAEKDGALSFGQVFSTKKYCMESQESDFQKTLESVARYHFTSRGELIFDLKYDTGTATFR